MASVLKCGVVWLSFAYKVRCQPKSWITDSPPKADKHKQYADPHRRYQLSLRAANIYPHVDGCQEKMLALWNKEMSILPLIIDACAAHCVVGYF